MSRIEAVDSRAVRVVRSRRKKKREKRGKDALITRMTDQKGSVGPIQISMRLKKFGKEAGSASPYSAGEREKNGAGKSKRVNILSVLYRP